MAEQFYYLNESDRRKIAGLLRDAGAGGSTVPGFEPQDRQLAKIGFKCTAACPAYGVMRVTGATLNPSGWPRYDTAQPNTTLQRFYLVNSGSAALLGDGGAYYGWGTWLHHGGHVLYDTANTPAYGETWGPADGVWTIKKSRWGFNILGGNTGTGATSRTLAVQHIVNHVLGKTNASHAKSASGTVNLYAGTLGSETQVTSMTVTAYNRFAAVATGKWVHCSWVNGGWDLSAAEC